MSSVDLQNEDAHCIPAHKRCFTAYSPISKVRLPELVVLYSRSWHSSRFIMELQSIHVVVDGFLLLTKTNGYSMYARISFLDIADEDL